MLTNPVALLNNYLHMSNIYIFLELTLFCFPFQEEVDNEQLTRQQSPQAQEEWMLICQGSGVLQPDSSTQEDFDWTAVAQSYPNLEDALTFVTRHRQQTAPHVFSSTANPDSLQGAQLDV